MPKFPDPFACHSQKATVLNSFKSDCESDPVLAIEASRTEIKKKAVFWADQLASFPFKRKDVGRPVTTVAFFYMRLYEGGVERVVSLQIPVLLSLGYRVILFVNKRRPETEFPVPESVPVITIPSSYDEDRAAVWAKHLKEFDVDLVIHHAANNRELLFDAALIRGLGLYLIIQRHELTTQDLLWGKKSVQLYPHFYRLADALIVLSTMEQLFYSHLGINTFKIPNPLSNTGNPRKGFPDGKKILWIARLELLQKNYTDALEIFRKVHEAIPEATLDIVGAEFTRGAYGYIENFCRTYRLTDSVHLAGHCVDVNPFYESAAVHLVTSRYESYCQSIAESKSIGVPLVTYEMPYLDILKNGKGYLSVPQHAIEEAADAVIRILKNPDLAQRLSGEAVESIQEMRSFDQCKAWREILASVQMQPAAKVSLPAANQSFLFWDTLFGFYDPTSLSAEDAGPVSAKISKLKQYPPSVLWKSLYKSIWREIREKLLRLFK